MYTEVLVSLELPRGPEKISIVFIMLLFMAPDAKFIHSYDLVVSIVSIVFGCKVAENSSVNNSL